MSCPVLSCPVLSCHVICYAVLCCAVLYCTVLCRVLLFFALLWCDVMLCDVMWFVVMWWDVMWCNSWCELWLDLWLDFWCDLWCDLWCDVIWWVLIWFKFIPIHQIDSNWSILDSNWSKVIQSDSKWFKMIQRDSKGFKMIQNDSRLFKLIQNNSMWFKVTHISFWFLAPSLIIQLWMLFAIYTNTTTCTDVRKIERYVWNRQNLAFKINASSDVTVKSNMIEDRPFYGTSICSNLTRTCKVSTIKMSVMGSTVTNKVRLELKVQIIIKSRDDKLDQ